MVGNPNPTFPAMSFQKCRITFPEHLKVAPTLRPRSRARRFAQLVAELFLTACISSFVLIALFYLLGFPEDHTAVHGSGEQAPGRSNISVIGILCLSTACTVVLYCVFKGAIMLVNAACPGFRCRASLSCSGAACSGSCGSVSYGACGSYDGMRALEAGWGPILAITDGRGHAQGKMKLSGDRSAVNR